MEQALAAILDEAAAKAEEEDRIAEQEAAQREGGPLGFLEEEDEEVDAEGSSGESKGASFACTLLKAELFTSACSLTSRMQPGQNKPACHADAIATAHSFVVQGHAV